MDAVAERQSEFLRQDEVKELTDFTHARQQSEWLTERGIHAPPDDHPTIREAAKSLADRLAKKRKPTNPTKG